MLYIPICSGKISGKNALYGKLCDIGTVIYKSLNIAIYIFVISATDVRRNKKFRNVSLVVFRVDCLESQSDI